MPKLESAGIVKKINLAQIIETGNVRKDYEGIEALAATIKANGQLQPILVKAHGKNADGVDEYELVAGHRRIRAFRHLCDCGDDFNRIDAVVTSGDKLTLQLIENLQRSDLTASERERGIYEMSKDGKVSQKDIAVMLGKNEQYVWRNISACKIRELTDKAGLDTSGISTNTLCEIASAADGDIPLLIERLKEEGGTLAAARRIGREYRGVAEPELTTESKNEAAPEIEPQFDEDEDTELTDDEPPLDIDIEPVPHISELDTPRGERTPPVKPAPQQNHIPRETRTFEDFDPPHKSVDINDVLVLIKEYIDKCEHDICDGAPSSSYNVRLQNKMDAAWDIIALLHKEL